MSHMNILRSSPILLSALQCLLPGWILMEPIALLCEPAQPTHSSLMSLDLLSSETASTHRLIIKLSLLIFMEGLLCKSFVLFFKVKEKPKDPKAPHLNAMQFGKKQSE